MLRQGFDAGENTKTMFTLRKAVNRVYRVGCGFGLRLGSKATLVLASLMRQHMAHAVEVHTTDGAGYLLLSIAGYNARPRLFIIRSMGARKKGRQV